MDFRRELLNRAYRHWVVTYNPDESSEYPWFVEHRWSDDDHGGDWHEYGSFSTSTAAESAMVGWYVQECER